MNPSGQVNAYDYSILPGAHTIRFKAWTGGSSPCEETDVNTTVSDNISPTTAINLDDKPNNDPVTESTSTPDLWFGVPILARDAASTRMAPSPPPTRLPPALISTANPRLYYVESNAQGSDTPGERYSIVFGQNGENFTHFMTSLFLGEQLALSSLVA